MAEITVQKIAQTWLGLSDGVIDLDMFKFMFDDQTPAFLTKPPVPRGRLYIDIEKHRGTVPVAIAEAIVKIHRAHGMLLILNMQLQQSVDVLKVLDVVGRNEPKVIDQFLGEFS